jgi:hypothetical protein
MMLLMRAKMLQVNMSDILTTVILITDTKVMSPPVLESYNNLITM